MQGVGAGVNPTFRISLALWCPPHHGVWIFPIDYGLKKSGSDITRKRPSIVDPNSAIELLPNYVRKELPASLAGARAWLIGSIQAHCQPWLATAVGPASSMGQAIGFGWPYGQPRLWSSQTGAPRGLAHGQPMVWSIQVTMPVGLVQPAQFVKCLSSHEPAMATSQRRAL